MRTETDHASTARFAAASGDRIKRIQRVALALLLLSGIVNYIDRATLAIANPLIREELAGGASTRAPSIPGIFLLVRE